MTSKFPKKVKEKNEQLSDLQDFELPDPRKDPFFIKQLEKAKEFMKNNPVPLELLRAK
ncbi:hypothetical protein [Chitinophaga sancti]|uniref:hypothetical protein n=1 Tax=Chitinophaga sancti TaxID=1004 RepID=UPI003F7A93F5